MNFNITYNDKHFKNLERLLTYVDLSSKHDAFLEIRVAYSQSTGINHDLFLDVLDVEISNLQKKLFTF